MEFIKNNYEWLFSGAGIAVILFIVNHLYKKNKNGGDQNNSVVINNNINPSEKLPQDEIPSSDKRKSNISILFIDDKHTDFRIVSILKKTGWINTKSVKDVINLDDPKVVEADIIFVDINGVGTTLFKDEGLGLASALKKKYLDKKIVIYSSNPEGDRSHKALREVDEFLFKDAEPFQFTNLIERFTNELNK